MGNKPVSKWVANKQEDRVAAQTGSALLAHPEIALVKYKNKKWKVGELLNFLAARVKELEKNQCKPDTSCLFEGREYIEDKHIPGAKLGRNYCNGANIKYRYEEE